MSRLFSTALLIVGLTAGPAPAQTQPNPYKMAALAQQRLLRALEIGDTRTAGSLMRQYPEASTSIIDRLEDPHGKAARTAYDVRKQAAEDVMAETARRMQQDKATRGKLVSVEVGGTAGKEGPGFTPKTADLDFQFRAADPESARVAAETARAIMKERGVPDQWKINPFAAAPDSTPIPTRDSGLTRTQTQDYDRANRRLNNPEASIGDATDAVRRDYYERGMAREIQPDGSLGRPITVEQLYEKRGLPPPEVTPASAFGTAVNERANFSTVGTGSGAKRVTRAADALDLVDPNALTPAERQTVDFARKVYETRDPKKVLAELPPDHPVRQSYDELRRTLPGGDQALAQLLALEDAKARRVLDKAVEQTLQTKLDDVARTVKLTDAELTRELRARADAGDVHARTAIGQIDAARGTERVELLKVARERLAESKRITLVEEFCKMDVGQRTHLASHPDFANQDLVKAATLLADIRNGVNEVLSRAVERLNSQMGRANTEIDRQKPPRETAAHYAIDIPGSGALSAADNVMMGLAVTGMLTDVYGKTMDAYRKGGSPAAFAAFASSVGANAQQTIVGMAIGYAAERAGLLAESLGLVARGATHTLMSALIVKDVIDLSRAMSNAGWQALQDPLLKGALDPTSGSSFYDTMKMSPATLASDLYQFALDRGLDPHDTDAVLKAAIAEYTKEMPRWGSNTVGMADRLREALRFQADLSETELTALAIEMATNRPAGADAVKATLDEKAKADEKANADAAALIAKEKAAAEAALRAARERRKEKDEQAAKDRKTQQAKDLAEEARRKAEALAAAEGATDESRAKKPEPAPAAPSQSRWDALKQQADADARRRAEAEEAARRKAADEAARRRAADEAARKAEEDEAALFDEVDIDLIVPSGLKPGGQGSIGVTVRAPKGLSLAGRRVRIAVSPGHTDEASLPLTGGTTVRTVYTAPAEYNGMVRVTVNLDGRRQATRTFAVGTAEAEAPPETAPPPPSKEVTLPETPDPPAPTAAAFADGTYTITLNGPNGWRPSGVIQVRGGSARGRLSTGVMPPGPHRGVAGQTSMDVEASAKGARLEGTYKVAAKATQTSGGSRIELADNGNGRIAIVLKPGGALEWQIHGKHLTTRTEFKSGSGGRGSLDDVFGHPDQHPVDQGPLGGRWVRK